MALSSTVSGSNWNSEILVFVEAVKPGYLEKKNRDENQKQTQPTYDVTTRNRTRAHTTTPSLLLCNVIFDVGARTT